jgi:hypothetical protein
MHTIYKAKVTIKFAHLLDVRELIVDFDRGDDKSGDDRLREIRFDSLDDLASDREMCSACNRVRSSQAICPSRALSCTRRYDQLPE